MVAADDPTCTDPDKYRTIFENDVVRVLEYRDTPGAVTAPHRHPDSVMYTLTGFSRRLSSGGATRDVELEAGQVHWLPAQEHCGENIGSTDTHVLFVELKVAGSAPERAGAHGATRPGPST
jgi:beta-alanine degradation protein BauB